MRFQHTTEHVRKNTPSNQPLASKPSIYIVESPSLSLTKPIGSHESLGRHSTTSGWYHLWLMISGIEHSIEVPIPNRLLPLLKCTALNWRIKFSFDSLSIDICS